MSITLNSKISDWKKRRLSVGFELAKTEKATPSNPKPISVYITDDTRVVMDRCANRDNNLNKYVFPVPVPGLTALCQYELIELFIRFINDGLVKIRKNLRQKK